MAVAVQVIGFGGALQALWAATGSVLNGAAVVGEAFGHGAQALNNVAQVAEMTSLSYLDEAKSTRKSKQLEMQRQFEALEASGTKLISAE